MNPRKPAPQADFNRIAHPYRWLEYLTLGRSLERCRLHFLTRLTDRTHALVLGDGDGRFLARLLQQNANLHADAVDSSTLMLRILRERCSQASSTASSRLKTHHADAQAYLAEGSHGRYDLVVTHFFLDCLTPLQVAQLVTAVTPRLAPGAVWLVSDFSIPSGVMRLPATLLVRVLYLAFRALTGLRVSRLPNHAAILSASGFTLSAQHVSLLGTIASEIWSPSSHSARLQSLEGEQSDPVL